jgi:hypothetical protein
MDFNFNREIAEYSIAVAGYEARHGLPLGILSSPDHIAVKTPDIQSFDQMVRSVGEIADEVYCLETEPRFLIAAKIAGRLSVGLHGHVSWIEIKESTHVGDAVPEFVRLEHAEFYIRDFNKAIRLIRQKGLDAEVESDGDHHRINITLTEAGQELRITNTHLTSIVSEKLQSGEAYTLKRAA